MLIYTYQKSKKKSKTKKELAEYQAWIDNLNNQKTNFSKKNIYQDHPSLNNVKIDNSIVRYNEIMKGGTLIFRMTKKIN